MGVPWTISSCQSAESGSLAARALGPHGPGLPVLATGGRRLWDVPPTVTLGQDLQQGSYDRTGSDRFAAVSGCCKSSNLLNVTLSTFPTLAHFHAEEPVPNFTSSSTRCPGRSLGNTLSLI